jgi:excisionase family DNA binding protein
MVERLYSVAAVADLFEVSEPTVRRWIRSSQLPVTRLGRTIRIRGAILLEIARSGFPDTF